MRTIETTVYSFSELSERAQENALEKLYDINVSDEFWYEYTLDEFIRILNTIGLDTRLEDIQFRGFSSQGDGLSFTGHYTYAKNSLQKIIAEFPTWHGLHSDIKSLQEIQRKNFYRIEGNLYRHSTYYCHEATVKFDGWLPETLYSDNMNEKLTEIFRSIMQEFYMQLSKEYDYLTSKESIIETIECNGYEFPIDGILA